MVDLLDIGHDKPHFFALSRAQFFQIIQGLAEQAARESKEVAKEAAKDVGEPESERDVDDLWKFTTMARVKHEIGADPGELANWCKSVGLRDPEPGFYPGLVLALSHMPDDEGEETVTICVEGDRRITFTPVLGEASDIFSNGRKAQISFFNGECGLRDKLKQLDWADPDRPPIGTYFEYGGSSYVVEAVLT